MRTTMGTTITSDQDTRTKQTRPARDVDRVHDHDAVHSREQATEDTGPAYNPAPEAPRSARRVAMRVRREQERRLAGW